MKLALGTVQFGLPYGIANPGGQISREDARQILALARESCIDTLDTAIAYGDSEACLGTLGTKGFKVITKLPALPKGVTGIAAWVGDQMQASLRRLKLDSVYGLLLHRSENLLGAAGRSMVQALERLKAEGIVQKIGVSIYAPQELDAATQACAIDLVQAPLNLVDRRLVTSGWLPRLHDQGVEVHTRSAFLQGLLLMPRETIPEKFSSWFHLFDHWHAWLQEHPVTAAEACLAFIASQPLIDRVVVGVDSHAQLQELLRAAGKEPPQQLPDLHCDDEKLINPSNWNSF